MKKKYLNFEQVKYLHENIQVAADKTEHIIKDQSKISIITAGSSKQTIKTGHGINLISRLALTIVNPTGLAALAFDFNEDEYKNINLILPSSFAKAITSIIDP